MLLEIFIIIKESSTLLLHRAFTKKKMGVDGQLFSGLISAISMFFSELKMGQVNSFEIGAQRVLISPYEGIVIVGVVEEQKEAQFVQNSLKKIGEKFWLEFKELLTEWDGEISVFKEYESKIDKIVYSEFAKSYISAHFPKKMIGVVRQFQNIFEKPIVRYIGLKVGNERSKHIKMSKNLKNKLHKELDLFSINKITERSENEIIIEVKMCPFCRKIKNKEFNCDFLTGFIEGFAMQFLPDKAIEVTETECIAHGNEACVFNLSIK
ncbi:MAG: V4R domain-containing protein [Promethearchaeota archaeon]